jgi:hypothetical protein
MELSAGFKKRLQSNDLLLRQKSFTGFHGEDLLGVENGVCTSICSQPPFRSVCCSALPPGASAAYPRDFTIL